jgi:hypothetical protein
MASLNFAASNSNAVASRAASLPPVPLADACLDQLERDLELLCIWPLRELEQLKTNVPRRAVEWN